jgi:serine/threonine protein kinase
MTIEAATAFGAALLGVKVMHDGRWLHRDLKPVNIGLIGRPLRSILLDVGTSRHIYAGGSLPPEPRLPHLHMKRCVFCDAVTMASLVSPPIYH